MAGNEIYIGKMLESFNKKMDNFSADMTESVTAMRDVEARLITVAQNTSQLISSVKVTNINPDSTLILNKSTVNVHYSITAKTDTFVPSALKLSSFASGIIDFNFGTVTGANGNGYASVYPAIRVGDSIYSHSVAVPKDGTIAAFNISANVQPGTDVEIGVVGKLPSSASTSTKGIGDVIFPVGITAKWALAEITNAPLVVIT